MDSLSASARTTVSVATLEMGTLDEAFLSVFRIWSVTLCLKRVAFGTAGVTRDDRVAAARAPPVGAGMEFSSWDVALVVRVEGLVALAAGFAFVLVFIDKFQSDDEANNDRDRQRQSRVYHVMATRSRAFGVYAVKRSRCR